MDTVLKFCSDEVGNPLDSQTLSLIYLDAV